MHDELPHRMDVEYIATKRKGLRWLVTQIKTASRDECWLYPFGECERNLYGRLMFRYRMERAHRVAWMLEHGESLPNDRSMVVMHDCDTPRCCNPDHLELGTQSANIQAAHDRGLIDVARGERQHKSDLTADDVRRIRERHAAGESQSLLGREHGVSQVAIHMIVKRKTWQHVT